MLSMTSQRALRHFDFGGRNLECGRMLEVLFHRTQVRRTNERVAILIGEVAGNLDLEIDLINHTAERIAVNALYDLNAIGCNAALTTKAQDVDPSTSADRRKEDGERCWGAGGGGLVGGDCEAAEVGVHAGTAWEVDDHFHFENTPYDYCGDQDHIVFIATIHWMRHVRKSCKIHKTRCILCKPEIVFVCTVGFLQLFIRNRI